MMAGTRETRNSRDLSAFERVRRHRIQSGLEEPTSPPQEILLHRTYLQDKTIAALRYAPTVTYILITISYSGLLFLSPRSLSMKLFLIFSTVTMFSGAVWWFHIQTAFKIRDMYEFTILKTPSISYPVNETIWADRLTEAEYSIKYKLPQTIIYVAELAIWVMFDFVVYFCIHVLTSGPL